MSVQNHNLYSYSSSLVHKFFEILDLTKVAETEEDFKNIEKFVSGITVEIEGSLKYYTNVKYGKQMTNVLMKISGIEKVSDYNVRRKAVLDSIEIVNRIKNSLTDGLVIEES